MSENELPRASCRLPDAPVASRAYSERAIDAEVVEDTTQGRFPELKIDTSILYASCRLRIVLISEQRLPPSPCPPALRPLPPSVPPL